MYNSHVGGFGLRVVLEPRYQFLFDEGFGVRSMTRAPAWNSVRCRFDPGYLGLLWYKPDKNMDGNHGGLDIS